MGLPLTHASIASSRPLVLVSIKSGQYRWWQSVSARLFACIRTLRNRPELPQQQNKTNPEKTTLTHRATFQAPLLKNEPPATAPIFTVPDALS
jgi:hypothetical protein